MVRGWRGRYLAILREFGYSERKDIESASRLDSLLGRAVPPGRLARMIEGRDVVVVGAGPSLTRAVPRIKNTNAVRIVSDSAVGPVVRAGIVPDVVVTDLDGDLGALEQIARTRCVFVVHAHGDNMERLEFALKFTNRMGTTQSRPFGKLHNFGGFTDGDRAAFLASHFGARRIILVGMDLGGKIGRHSGTRRQERTVKLQKLARAKSLLEWLATFSGSELLTTSGSIPGFTKIPLRGIDSLAPRIHSGNPRAGAGSRIAAHK